MKRAFFIALICAGCISFEPIQRTTPVFCTPNETVCDGKDDDCDGSIDEGLVVDCSNCLGAGTRTCDNGVFSQCNAPATGAETCNNIDDDCDGEIDGISQACTTCMGSGTETCVAGAWLNCTAPPGVAESCNDEDDDCDGAIDEDLVEQCSTACGAGVRTCMGGVFGACSATTPVTEICNNVDDDCANGIDNGVTQPCNDCRGVGIQTCSAGSFGTCSTAPTGETCNNVDDDCVGGVDNGLMQACSSCRGVGTQTCSAGAWGTCTTAPTGETCNNADDDCVGGVDNFTRGCNDCRGAGTQLCTTGAWGSCSTAPTGETCNGIDDNCAGGVDEGFAIGTACDAGDADTCANGVIVCGAPGPTGCSGDVAPAVYDFCAGCNSTYTPPGYVVGSAQGSWSGVSAAWNGTEWGIAWNTADSGGDRGEVYFSRVSAAGVPVVGSERQLSGGSTGNSKGASIAWDSSNSRWAVIWMDDNDLPVNDTGEVWMQLIGSSGNLVGSAVDVDGPSARKNWFPKVAWHPTLVKWYAYWECGPNTDFEPTNICVRQLDADLGNGSPTLNLDPTYLVFGGGVNREIALSPAFISGQWQMGIAYRNGSAINFCQTGTSWTGCGALATVSDAGGNDAPSLAFNGTLWRIFFNNTGTTLTDTAAIDGTPGGTDLGLNPGVGETVFGGAMWSGTHFWFTFHRTIGATEIHVTRVSSAGAAVSPLARLTNEPSFSSRPQIFAGNGGALVGWFDGRGAMIQAIRCP